MKKVILINDTSNEAHIGSRCVVSIIQTLCQKYDLEIIRTYTRREIVERANNLDEGICMADIIIINGEGSLHDNPTFFKKTMKKIPKDKKTVIVNTVWQDMKHVYGIDKVDLISVRESKSLAEILKIVPKEKVSLVPDLLFYKDFSNLPKIGYCDSVNHKIRSTFMKEMNYFPLSFIHEGTYLSPKVINYPTIETYMNWLTTLDVLVTGRFHSICMAMIMQTPFLVYSSNSHKIEGLLRDASVPELLVRQQKDIPKKIELAKSQIDKTAKYVQNANVQIEEFWKKVSEL